MIYNQSIQPQLYGWHWHPGPCSHSFIVNLCFHGVFIQTSVVLYDFFWDDVNKHLPNAQKALKIDKSLYSMKSQLGRLMTLLELHTNVMLSGYFKKHRWPKDRCITETPSYYRWQFIIALCDLLEAQWIGDFLLNNCFQFLWQSKQTLWFFLSLSFPRLSWLKTRV